MRETVGYYRTECNVTKTWKTGSIFENEIYISKRAISRENDNLTQLSRNS